MSIRRINMVLHRHDVNRVVTTGILSLRASTAGLTEEISTCTSISETSILTPSDWSLVDAEEGIEIQSLQIQEHYTERHTLYKEDSISGSSFFHGDDGPQIGCRLCLLYGNNRKFKSMGALERHLSSPAHDQKAFKCPTALLLRQDQSRSTETRFLRTLSGMTQHMETGKCFGGKATLWKMLDFLRLEVLQLEWPGRFLQE